MVLPVPALDRNELGHSLNLCLNVGKFLSCDVVEAVNFQVRPILYTAAVHDRCAVGDLQMESKVIMDFLVIIIIALDDFKTNL